VPDTSLDLSVYLVTDAAQCQPLGVIETVAAALRGGVTAVQLRDKHASDAELVALGRALRERMEGSGVPLIVNDRVEVAAAIGAGGLHVGQSDAGIHEARERLGPEAILGLSVQTVEHAGAVDSRLVDYVGIGPVFATPTKPDHAPPLGFDGLAKVCAASPVPAVAIGGLGAEHLVSVLAAGAVGAALVSAICSAADPEKAARALAEASRRARAAVEART
jgi:thiamine-phosphate pyrophosphorylase